MDVDDDSQALWPSESNFFFLLAASQNKNPQLFGTTAAAASTRSETKDERYNKNLSFSSFFVIGLFFVVGTIRCLLARRRSRHIVGSFLASAFLSSSSFFFAAPFFYFNQISPFYMLPFICMSSQCQKDVAPTPTEL
jgi:hypothetical protein